MMNAKFASSDSRTRKLNTVRIMHKKIINKTKGVTNLF